MPPTLHFAHANGYPPGAYEPLLACLRPHYPVTAPPARPLWPNSDPAAAPDWFTLTQDLIAQVTALNPPVLGVGHSLGAVTTLWAGLERPELFRALVLLDPVLFVRPFLWLWAGVKALGLGYRLHPLIPGALRRRRVFPSTQEMFTRYRKAPVFQRLDDAALQAYVQALAAPTPDGQVQLTYSPEWEAHIYHSGPPNLWARLPQLRLPTLVIYGAHSDTFSPRALAALRRAAPHVQAARIEAAGHLVPLEKPAEVAEHMLAFLQAVTGHNSTK